MKGEVKYLSYMFVENALIFLGILHPLHSDPPFECSAHQLQYV